MKLAHFNWVEIILETDLPSNAKYLALYLATFMNGKNQVAWPSLSRITHETGLSRPTVIKWLDYMDSEGWLIKTQSVRTTRGGCQANNEYAINLPKSIAEGGKTNLPPYEEGGKTACERGLNDFQKGVKPFNPNNNRINNNNNNKGKSKKFVKPTVKQVQEYGKEIGFAIDAERFVDHHEARGWMLGKNKMKDWKAAVRTWKHNAEKWEPEKQQSNGGLARRSLN